MAAAESKRPFPSDLSLLLDEVLSDKTVEDVRSGLYTIEEEQVYPVSITSISTQLVLRTNKTFEKLEIMAERSQSTLDAPPEPITLYTSGAWELKTDFVLRQSYVLLAHQMIRVSFGAQPFERGSSDDLIEDKYYIAHLTGQRPALKQQNERYRVKYSEKCPNIKPHGLT